jgi:hypothetical protein
MNRADVVVDVVDVGLVRLGLTDDVTAVKARRWAWRCA